MAEKKKPCWVKINGWDVPCDEAAKLKKKTVATTSYENADGSADTDVSKNQKYRKYARNGLVVLGAVTLVSIAVNIYKSIKSK